MDAGLHPVLTPLVPAGAGETGHECYYPEATVWGGVKFHATISKYM